MGALVLTFGDEKDFDQVLICLRKLAHNPSLSSGCCPKFENAKNATQCEAVFDELRGVLQKAKATLNSEDYRRAIGVLRREKFWTKYMLGGFVSVLAILAVGGGAYAASKANGASSKAAQKILDALGIKDADAYLKETEGAVPRRHFDIKKRLLETLPPLVPLRWISMIRNRYVDNWEKLKNPVRNYIYRSLDRERHNKYSLLLPYSDE